MAEKILSPGVFTRENDTSFLPAQPIPRGAAIIGPTVKGPVLRPITVQNFGEFETIFGSILTSGSDEYQYFTSLTARDYFQQGGDNLTVVRVAYNSGSDLVAPATATFAQSSGSLSTAFSLETFGKGGLYNTTYPETSNGALETGSVHGIRWEITSVNPSQGTFNLQLRRGDDNHKQKIILETWNNLSLDPKSSNYISRRIGDKTYNMKDSNTGNPYLQSTGTYANRSALVRVSSVSLPTPDYIDQNGNIRLDSLSGSLPQVTSGTFGGGSDGSKAHPMKFYDEITSTNAQGMNLELAAAVTAYTDALDLIKNKDLYNIDLIVTPGVVYSLSSAHASVITKAVDVCEERNDCMTVPDLIERTSGISDANSQAGNINSSYAATYYPWLKLPDSQLGGSVWVPASVIVPGLYARNDRLGAKWTAPAGEIRGSTLAVESARDLTRANRDSLYDNNVNPIYTRPNTGYIVSGQKTLQKRASALDRVNVRRLITDLKKFVNDVGNNLLFEQNTAETRARFVNTLNPYMERIQQQGGLYAYRVVMDDTNNTPDVIDRNILYGQVYIQPTRTAEFIIIDFNVQPTGAELE